MSPTTRVQAPAAAHPEAFAAIFSEAHTTYQFLDAPVTDEALHQIYEIMRFAPTSLNAQPLRVLYVREGAKDRLISHLGEGNRPKTTSAPVAAILAYDHDFHDHLPVVNPRIPNPAEMFADSEGRHDFARLNASIQIGYFILAARAVGLDVGPMAGFDNAGVDQEFFAGTSWRSLAVANLGYAAEDGQFPRFPRLEPNQAFTIISE